MTGCIHGAARNALLEPDPARKCSLVASLLCGWMAGSYDHGTGGRVLPLGEPGRPSRPLLVPPGQLAQRRLSTAGGRAALVHAVTHIEFNAINLALDAVYRFRAMPAPFYRDWLQVAVEEARHFAMLHRRLQELGNEYGDFPAHDGLWSMCRQTAHDPLLRMALVPRVLEARGLDVTPGMMQRLGKVGDHRTAALLEVILAEEQGHVAIGSRWYRYCCQQRGVEPESTFQRLLRTYMPGRVRGPFNRTARLGAGFSGREMDDLAALAAEQST